MLFILQISAFIDLEELVRLICLDFHGNGTLFGAEVC